MAVLYRIGGLLVVLGFGSLVLNQMDYEFTLLSWATDYQPGIGVVIGIVGVALIAVGLVLQNSNKNARQ
jgi:hypothetical protein